ncbi:MAG: secretin N-terminal domain-containing protein [Planctomycetota bacterium]
MNIVYDPQMVDGQQVSVKSPAEIPASSLRNLVEAVLRSKNLALAEDQVAGLARVVPMDQLAQTSRVEDDGRGVVTRVFPIAGLSANDALQLVRPFLTPGAGQAHANPTLRVLIVTDFAANVDRVASLIDRLTGATGPAVQRYYAVKHLAAPDLAAMLYQALGAGLTSSESQEAALPVDVIVDEPANRLLFIGGETQVKEALQLADTLDIDAGLLPRVYRFRHTSASRFEAQVRSMLDASVSTPAFESSVDAEAGIMILTAPVSVHTRVEALQQQLDMPGDETNSPIRFYPLQNVDAARVLKTLANLDPSTGLLPPGLDPVTSPDVPTTADAPPPRPRENFSPDLVDPFNRSSGDEEDGISGSVRTPNAVLTADENTNSIIVVGDPSAQRLYAALIQQLDQRRAQVMIEVTLITLDTTDNFSLGVDILAGDQTGGNQSFVFNSFGLSEIGGDGRLDLLPGLGFNGVVLDADIADVVVRALKADGNTRVVSAPRVLVNDNETGTIASVSGQPVSSFNQGQNSDTVTFEGFVEAGTSIEMTPHIAEGDHLRLEFKIALESFTGEAADSTLPPPRQSNTVESHVTLPDGATIVVGGINRTNFSEQVNRVPILGELPILELLFSNRTITESQSTLFVFLRPIVLRQERFEDLRFYSKSDVRGIDEEEDAGLDSQGYPLSEPEWIW